MHIDFLGPLTQTLNGNSYVGLAVCALTKYVEAAGKIANTKLPFFSIKILLRFKPTATGGGSNPKSDRNVIYGRPLSGDGKGSVSVKHHCEIFAQDDGCNGIDRFLSLHEDTFKILNPKT